MEKVSLGKCPACDNGEVVETPKAFSCSTWKEGCKFTIWKNSLEKLGIPSINSATIKRLLKGETVVLKLKSRNSGKEFEAPVKITNDEQWGWGIKLFPDKDNKQ